MTEVLGAIAGVTGLGGLAFSVWLVVTLVKAKDQLTDALVGQTATEQHLSEANFKLAQVQAALTKELALNETQAKELSDAIALPPNPDLPAGDVHDRVVRLLQSLSTPKPN